jgi:hypothetical protein
MDMPVRLNGVYYGTKDAADKIGRTEGRVRQMIRKNELAAVEISPRVWLVPEKELTRLLRVRGEVATG